MKQLLSWLLPGRNPKKLAEELSRMSVEEKMLFYKHYLPTVTITELSHIKYLATAYTIKAIKKIKPPG